MKNKKFYKNLNKQRNKNINQMKRDRKNSNKINVF